MEEGCGGDTGEGEGLVPESEAHRAWLWAKLQRGDACGIAGLSSPGASFTALWTFWKSPSTADTQEAVSLFGIFVLHLFACL